MSEDAPKQDPKTKRILVVDDDGDLRELLTALLLAEGFQVEEAVDGQDALAKLTAAPPDMMILDLMLPKLNGLDLLDKLEAEGSPDFPVLVVSGVFRDEMTCEKVRAHSRVVDFREKPVELPRLKELLHRTLNTRPPA